MQQETAKLVEDGQDEAHLSSAQLTMAVLFKILKLYQSHLPEAIADAGFDGGKLLTQVLTQQMLALLLRVFRGKCQL